MMEYLLLILTVVVLASDTNGGVLQKRALSDQQLMQQLSTSNAKFSFDIYNKFAPENKNLIISPFSIYTVLAMTSLGSKGQTTDEIYKTLNIQSLGENVHQAFRYYTSLLQGLTNVTLNTANGIFMDPNMQLLADFSYKTKTYYDAKAEKFDLTNPKGPEAPINDWVSKQTAGMIKDALAPGTISANTAMLLINAIYFKGTWLYVFDEDQTTKQKFHVDASTSVDVDMMTIDNVWFNYKRLDNLRTTVLELPYVGDRYSMFILLPDAIDGLAALESGLNSQTLESAVQNLNQRDSFKLSLPKVKIENKLELKEVLKELGIQRLFASASADLSGITGDRGLYAEDAFQKAAIEISERGTEAAAATVVVMTESLRLKVNHFNVNHPYMFVLRDKVAGVNLFYGRYTDPTEVSSPAEGEVKNAAKDAGNRGLNFSPTHNHPSNIISAFIKWCKYISDTINGFLL